MGADTRGTGGFTARVEAPQGGPIYVHEFGGDSVAEVLRTIAESVDLDAAESVTVRIAPGYRFDEFITAVSRPVERDDLEAARLAAAQTINAGWALPDGVDVSRMADAVARAVLSAVSSPVRGTGARRWTLIVETCPDCEEVAVAQDGPTARDGLLRWVLNGCGHPNAEQERVEVAEVSSAGERDVEARRSLRDEIARALLRAEGFFDPDEGDVAAWLGHADAVLAVLPSAGEAERVTHGRHCPCSACANQDWSDPNLAPCGMHGPSCPPRYAPYSRGPSCSSGSGQGTGEDA